MLGGTQGKTARRAGAGTNAGASVPSLSSLQALPAQVGAGWVGPLPTWPYISHTQRRTCSRSACPLDASWCHAQLGLDKLNKYSCVVRVGRGARGVIQGCASVASGFASESQFSHLHVGGRRACPSTAL